jgi:hypothetical protein
MVGIILASSSFCFSSNISEAASNLLSIHARESLFSLLTGFLSD